MEHLFLILNNFFKKWYLKYILAKLVARNHFDSITLSNIDYYQHDVPLSTPIPFYQISIATKFDSILENLIYVGLDQDFSLCAEKAFSELCEGVFQYQENRLEGLNRSGISAHLTFDMAKNKSYLELLERDSFLMHFLCPSLNNTSLELYDCDLLTLATNKLQSVDAEVMTVITSIYCKVDNVYYIGLASGLSLQPISSLIQRSQFEATMLYNNWTLPKFSCKTKTNTKYSTLLPHLISTQELSSQAALKEIAHGGSDKILNYLIDKEKLSVMKYKNYKSRSVVQAVHPQLIPLSFGEKWYQSKEYIQQILVQRCLTIENWGLHPLL